LQFYVAIYRATPGDPPNTAIKFGYAMIGILAFGFFGAYFMGRNRAAKSSNSAAAEPLKLPEEDREEDETEQN
jgi:hypothetical protein